MRNFHRALRILSLLVSGVLAGCASGAPGERDVSAVFFPPLPAEPRLQYLATLSVASDIEEKSGLASIVVGERAQLGVARPHGTAWFRDRLYVCDAGSGGVLFFDFASRELRGIPSLQPGTFQKPISIAVAPDGWKYVVDVQRKVVVVLDADDQFRTTFGDPASWRPVCVAATADRLFVADTSEHRIVVLDRASGKQVGAVGGGGKEPGKFFYPVEVVLGPEGDLWVTDSFNARVQRLRPDGTVVTIVGSIGAEPGTFTRPKSTAVDREGRAYVVDAAFENVQVFDPERRLLLYFGGPGAEPGSMNLPAHVTLSYEAAPAFADRVAEGYGIEYVLFVSNQLGDQRINVYGFLRKQ